MFRLHTFDVPIQTLYVSLILKTNTSRRMELFKLYVKNVNGSFLPSVCELTDNIDCSPGHVKRLIQGNVYLKKYSRLNLFSRRKRGPGQIYKSSLTVSQGGC